MLVIAVYSTPHLCETGRRVRDRIQKVISAPSPRSRNILHLDDFFLGNSCPGSQDFTFSCKVNGRLNELTLTILQIAAWSICPFSSGLIEYRADAAGGERKLFRLVNQESGN